MVRQIWIEIITMVLVISGLTACGGEIVTETDEGKSVKTGISLTADVTGSKDASEEEAGLSKAEVLAVAVTVSEDGKIDDCRIDQIPAEISFDDQGLVLTEMNTEFPTKDRMGESYGMKQASGLGKEWNEQAEAFADYVKGMTMEQVAAIALDEYGRAVDPGLMSSVTISVSDFMEGLDHAVRNAKSLGAKQGDVITMGIKATMEESEPAEGDDHGEASVHVEVTVETHDGTSVTSRDTEDYTAGVKFNSRGEITERVLDED